MYVSCYICMYVLAITCMRACEFVCICCVYACVFACGVFSVDVREDMSMGMFVYVCKSVHARG